MAGEPNSQVGDPAQALEGDPDHERRQHHHHQHLEEGEPALADGGIAWSHR